MYYGAQYYRPPFPGEECWPQDFERTQAMGFTCVKLWAVWNEPHLEPMYDYRPGLLCYCSHSKARFRVWLQEKYGSLQALNAAWRRTYCGWQEVAPPPRFGTWTDMLDWRRFWL